MSRLVDVCVALFPKAVGVDWKGRPDREGASWGLTNALRAYGLPRSTQNSEALLSVAESISTAMTASEITLTHICPLDLAGDLPAFRFGPCEIREFSQTQFEQLIELPRLHRHFASLRLDTAALSQFHWLVVRECVAVTECIGKRAMPFFSLNLGRDFGAITPHQQKLPGIVERAAFALLLLPWEDVAGYRDIDWRVFRIPWVYTVSSDPFVSPKWPPDPQTLSWEPDIFDDPATGETIELEKPVALPVQDGCAAMCATLTDGWWNEALSALSSPILNPLVAHFLIKAFSADGIDEFLSHVIVVEAALGLESDYRTKKMPKGSGPPLKAAKRVAARAACITGEGNAADEYEELFNLRSVFVHGRQLGEISSDKRILARSLARRVASSLVRETLTNKFTDRVSFLTALCP
jgi:hypothetical protein